MVRPSGSNGNNILYNIVSKEHANPVLHSFLYLTTELCKLAIEFAAYSHHPSTNEVVIDSCLCHKRKVCNQQLKGEGLT